MHKVLIVEDNQTELTRYISMINNQLDVFGVRSLEEAINAISKKRFDIIVTDIHLSSKRFDGIELIKYVKENYDTIPIVPMTSDPSLSTYQLCKKHGAVHFIKKPILTSDDLLIHVTEALEQKSSVAEPTKIKLPSEISNKLTDGIYISTEAKKRCEMAAKAKVLHVGLFGETGTGKEELAKFIHRRRQLYEHKQIPFVPVNCASLDSNRANYELFGYVKGAYTGATNNSIGYIGRANGGILFLDEIQYLSLDIQSRLLRVFNDGVYERMGDDRQSFSEFQVIVASTKDIDDLCNKGEFLVDLRQRLLGVDIFLRPLREMNEAFEVLVPLFLLKQGAELERPEIEKIVSRCKEFYWQGNIRSLKRVLETSFISCKLNEENFTSEKIKVFKSMLQPGDSLFQKSSNENKIMNNELVRKILQPLSEDTDLSSVVQFYERQIICNALKRYKNDKKLVWSALNIPRQVLAYKQKKYSIG